MPAISKEKLIQLHGERKSFREIAAYFNVTVGTIWYWAKKNNLKFRDQKEAIREKMGGKYKKFNPPLTEGESWALGVIASDGGIFHNRIEVKSIDEDMVDKLIAIIPIFKKRECYDKRYINYKYFSARVGNFELANKLKAFNITPRKSITLQPPDNIEEIFLDHYMRGLWDGDGYIGIGNKRRKTKLLVTSICTASVLMKDFICDLINQKNNKSPSCIISNKDRKNTLYSICLRGRKAEEWLFWIYQNSNEQNRLNRKYKRYINFLEQK